MRTSTILAAATIAFGLVVGGCSNNKNNPVSSNSPGTTATSTWDQSGGYWRSTVNATDYANFAYFSFATGDTVTSGASRSAAGVWDIAFRREAIELNGGSSADKSGDAVGQDLGKVDFDSVTIADTTGATWQGDAVDYQISDWYSYNPVTHAIAITRYVYTMLDAGGENYLKFQVDSVVGLGMPPEMGTVWISYYYQPTANSTTLGGTIEQASIKVGSDTGYFDFSSGKQVTPSDPTNSADWDIAFGNYNCMQNSGPNGSGKCAAFPAYTQMTDSTDIASLTSEPAGAPLFPDIPSSALTDWYNYNEVTHTLTSKSDTYLIKSGGAVYKLRIDSYYENIKGLPVSGNYTFIWKQL